MRKYLKLMGLTLATGLMAACSQPTSSAKAEKSYKDMTKAEQTIALQNLVDAFNAVAQNQSNSQSSSMVTMHHGDSELDIIYAVGTYQKHVSAKELRSVKKTIEKIKNEENICTRQEMIELTKLGIGYQAIMKDLSGKILYESNVCRGAPITAAKETPPEHKLRGRS